MSQIQEIEKKGTMAVKDLRIKKLQNGFPFMINSNHLPSNQCYLEYPDGSIKLVKIARSAKDFNLIRTLSTDEEKIIRLRYNLTSKG